MSCVFDYPPTYLVYTAQTLAVTDTTPSVGLVRPHRAFVYGDAQQQTTLDLYRQET